MFLPAFGPLGSGRGDEALDPPAPPRGPAGFTLATGELVARPLPPCAAAGRGARSLRSLRSFPPFPPPLPPPSGFRATCEEGFGAGDGSEPRGLIEDPRDATDGEGLALGFAEGL